MTTTPVTSLATRAPASAVRCAIVGVIAGFLSGLFGVGGGILIVPALVLVLGFDQRLAHGTSLAAVLPIAISSLTSYAIAGEVDYVVGGLLAAGAIGGAVIGTHILHKLPHDVLALAFAVLLLATAVRLILDDSDAGGRATLSVIGAVALVVIGFATGILAGLLGVGGGIIMVPVMVVGFGLPAAVAKGTSLLVIVPTAIMGTWRNRKKQNADMRVAVILGLAGVVSAFIGGTISVGMSEQLSNALFAGLLTIVALRMLWDLARSRRSAGGRTGAAAQPR